VTRYRLKDLDFANEVAEAEAEEVTRARGLVLALVEIDGEQHLTAREGEHLSSPYLRELCRTAEPLMRTFTLGCQPAITLRLPGDLGRLRVIGGTRRWSSYHYGTWIVVVDDTARAVLIHRALARSAARVDDYRLFLPAMRPTEDADLARRQRHVKRRRLVAVGPPRPPAAARDYDEIARVRRIHPDAVNGAEYRSYSEWIESLDWSEE